MHRLILERYGIPFTPPREAVHVAPDREFVIRDDEVLFVVPQPGPGPMRRRLCEVTPRKMNHHHLSKYGGLLSRCNTWARKYKIDRHGENLPTIRALAASAVFVEGGMELRGKLRDLLSRCAQSYAHHSKGTKDPFETGSDAVIQTTCAPIMWNPNHLIEDKRHHKRGWLIVLGVEPNGDAWDIHTHLGIYTFEHPNAPAWLEKWGLWVPEIDLGCALGSKERLVYPAGPPPVELSDREVALMRLLMEMIWDLSPDFIKEPVWDLDVDGSVDLGLLPETSDRVTKYLEEEQRSRDQVAMRYDERSQAKEREHCMERDPNWIEFYRAAEEQFEPELLWGAPCLPRPTAKQQNLGQRIWRRFEIAKALGLVALRHTKQARGSNWRKVIPRERGLRQEFTWTPSGEQEEITRLAWDLSLIRRKWVKEYRDPEGRLKETMNPDFFRVMAGAARYALERGDCLVTVYHRIDPVYWEDGEGEVRKNNRAHSKNRYFGAMRNRPTIKGGWWRYCPCAVDNPDRARKAKNNVWETPHKQDIHADICRVCGREAAVVDAHAYVPVSWFADILRIDDLDPDTHIVFPIYGKVVQEVMAASAYRVPLVVDGEKLAAPVSRREPEAGDIQWFEDIPFEATEDTWTYPARSITGAVTPTEPRERTFFVGPDRRLHVIAEGGHWVHDHVFPVDLKEGFLPPHRRQVFVELKRGLELPDLEVVRSRLLWDAGLDHAEAFLSAVRAWFHVTHTRFPRSKHWTLLKG